VICSWIEFIEILHLDTARGVSRIGGFIDHLPLGLFIEIAFIIIVFVMISLIIQLFYGENIRNRF
jgi:hypothetical protein